MARSAVTGAFRSAVVVDRMTWECESPTDPDGGNRCYWNSKPDGGGATLGTDVPGTAAATGSTADQRSDRLYGSYRWGGFMLGLVWDKSKLTSSTGVTSGTVLSDRTAWSIPFQYQTGNHNFYVHWDKARADTAAGFSRLDTKATMLAMAYAYDLSKRTSAAITYVRINNGTNAFYNLNASTGIAGTRSGAIFAGEDPRSLSTTIKHSF